MRKGSDVRYIKEVLGEEGKSIKIISKVENQEAWSTATSWRKRRRDGVAATSGWRSRPRRSSSRRVIEKCNAGKPVVTAAQMLESMVKNPRPASRGEASQRGARRHRLVMLSGETAAGAFRWTRQMSKICREAEVSIDHYQLFKTILAQVPIPMQPLSLSRRRGANGAESSRAHRGADPQRGHRLVAAARHRCTVFVPTLTTDSLTWQWQRVPRGAAGLTRV